ncbi:hypothetical protein OROMI_033078 [Orobanche minor]
MVEIVPEIVDVVDDQVATSEPDEVLTPPLRKEKVKKSIVWDEYVVVDAEQPGVKPRAFCSHCKVKSYIADSHYGTKNLLEHLKKCSAYKEFQSKCSEEKKPFNQMVYRDLVARAIIRHGYSFSWVEHEGNREIHAYLNNQTRTICRNTAKADCLKLHENLRGQLKEILRSVPGRICLTSDMWSSCQTLGYLCLTAHYVDSSWKLNSKVLNFLHMESGHTGHDMFSAVYKLLQDWEIEHKIFSITLDNASSNDKMQDYLRHSLNRGNSLVQKGEFFHIRCAAHVLNLILKDGLQMIEHCVVKIRESVKYVNWSESRKKIFNSSVRNSSINETKALWLDVATRWNSTYYMLDRALLYRGAFVDLSSSNAGYKYLPTETEWEMVEQLRDLLEPLCDITNLFSGRDYPIANLYFENVWRIGMLLKDLKNSDDLDLSLMAGKMKDKFDKYWFTSEGHDYNTLFAFALILDPRHQKEVLKHCFERFYDDEMQAVMKFNDVIYKLEKMFQEYAPPDAAGTTSNSRTKAKNSTAEKSSNRKRKFEFADIVIEKSVDDGSRKNKLTMYLEEPVLSQDPDTPFDVLNFWKENEVKYGELSHLARDIMTVPLTTVASESTFSIGDRVLDKWRSSSLPENVEALITSRSWLFGYADMMWIIHNSLVLRWIGTHELVGADTMYLMVGTWNLDEEM